MPPTPTRAEIVATVTEIVAKEFGQPVAGVTPDLDLSTLEGADSVKVLRAVAKIERAYDLEFEDEDVFALKCVDDVAGMIEKALGVAQR